MTSSTSRPKAAHPDPSKLGRALVQNGAAQETLEQSADELAVINAVLQQELPGHVQSGDVAMALEKNDALETRIQEAAQDLAEVNEALKQETSERAKLERALQATQNALADATSELPQT
jgi:C4-dicarboxylate-specific signal transduction histidine kinase